MKSTRPWILALYVLVSFIMISHSAAQVVAGVGNSGFISIDCGASEDYVDEQTGIWYQTDEGFIESGTNHEAPSSFRFNDRPYIQKQLNTLRSFPEGKRNCYTLKLNQDIYQNQKHKYLIRAIFAYQNYDYKNQFPKFDVYLGVNFWTTIQLGANNFAYIEVTMQHVTTDMVQVCLVDTGDGTPFINTLELRPLTHSLYSAPFPLSLYTRRDCGAKRFNYGRYKDDAYDRLWRIYDESNWDILETSEKVKVENSTFELPSEILLTACQPPNNSNILTTNFSFNIREQYYVFLHFNEIDNLPSGKKRIINVTVDYEKSLSQELTLDYMKPVTLISDNITTSDVSFSVRATSDSSAPPILNAFEIFKVFPTRNSPTDTQNVNAIMEIKHTYGISKISWQGDPCVPSNFAWEGLRCNSSNNTRIVSLNLSSSNLTGEISKSFADLKKLESLDLSNNELTGELPEFLATLPNLKFINVAGNKLTGSIPKALRENANLQLSVANNPGLCQLDSCDKENKFVIPLITSIIAVFSLIAIVSLIIWRLRKRRQGLSTKSHKMGVLKQKNREFSYSQVVHITDNFKTLIGEGGFGKVYLGTLEDNSQVAVKLLSPSSKQGYKEFQSEAQLLTIIHHRNLVSLVGFCHENNIKALVYEYMDNGDLGQLLSEKNSNVLKWNERLQVANDTAKGLEYLHIGCNTPIIHRDLKPSNILLNKSMVAKIADFGLSRAFTNEEDSHLLTRPAGTPGYIDPEFHRTGQLNKKSDIYSFGMILLQLITGRPPIKRSAENISFILDWAQPKIECRDIEGIVDPRLGGEFNVTSTWKAVEVAMLCVQSTPNQRPDISYIFQELQECLALEMDRARIDSTTTNSSCDYTMNSELITVVSAR